MRQHLETPDGSSDGQGLRLGSVQMSTSSAHSTGGHLPPPLPHTWHVQYQDLCFLSLAENDDWPCPFPSFFIFFLGLPFSTKGPHSFQRAGPREWITVPVVSAIEYRRVHRAGFPGQPPYCHDLAWVMLVRPSDFPWPACLLLCTVHAPGPEKGEMRKPIAIHTCGLGLI